MLIKKYDIGLNFKPVDEKFIDIRLIDNWVMQCLPITDIANIISHLLIYKDFLNSISEIAIISDQFNSDLVVDNMMYIINNNHISYKITKKQAKFILDLHPLSMSINETLERYLGFNTRFISTPTHPIDPWEDLFTK